MSHLRFQHQCLWSSTRRPHLLTCAAPARLIEHVAPSPVIDYIAPFSAASGVSTDFENPHFPVLVVEPAESQVVDSFSSGVLRVQLAMEPSTSKAAVSFPAPAMLQASPSETVSCRAVCGKCQKRSLGNVLLCGLRGRSRTFLSLRSWKRQLRQITIFFWNAFSSARWSGLSSLLRYRLSLLFQTLPLVTRASRARGVGVLLVVARSFALAIVTMQVKFASSMPMKTPVIGDRAAGYIVDSSGPTGNVRVSTIEPTHDESIPTTHVYAMSCESILENLQTASKGDVLAMVTKSRSAGTVSRVFRYAVYNYATMVGW